MSWAVPPVEEGVVIRDGVRLAYRVFGAGERTVLFLPPWSIVHSRLWKMQVPFLSRHLRVVTFDGRGNGGSDRPEGPAAYAARELTADALAVLDAAGAERAAVVGFSRGAIWALLLCAEHPERVSRAAFVSPGVRLVPEHEWRAAAWSRFDEPIENPRGWQKLNRHHILDNHGNFLQFFFGQCFPEPHSTKPVEDCLAWGLETTGRVLVDTALGPTPAADEVRALAAGVGCPVLVVHGDEDAVTPHAAGAALADATGGRLVTVEGGGHIPMVREPVFVNEVLRDFLLEPEPPRAWRRALRRRKRALFVSSPIGLGHARRDVAVANALREAVPGLEIDWLAQHPVTRVLEEHGERVHPQSVHLANESVHLEAASGDHDLHVFQAWRSMDEIFLTNFMAFRDLVRSEHYDLWIGDEAWEIDHYLHENPELKSAAYAWLTDFVGWLPLPDGGDREAALTADYNAEMIEHVERFPQVRDASIFIGEPDDIAPERFGPGLPSLREWAERHYDFSGYILGFDPAELADTERLRVELGYRPDERLAVATVGGTGVGRSLLIRAMEALPEARRQVPDLRMVAVAGPRIDPVTLPRVDGVEVRRYVEGLHRHLACSDVALVQGGLATTMELTATRRRFLYFPLRHHCEQLRHVHHRLQRYRAGRCVTFAGSTPSTIGEAMADELARPIDSLPVDPGGAARAAARLAELLG